MKISIITACRNAERYIEETMQSVLNQTAIKSGRVNLEYFVLDGLSTDNTVEIASRVGGTNVNLISAADTGLYDALSRGLQMCSGDVVAYINAGDYYHKSAFDVVLDVMEQKNSSWLTGLNIIYNDKSQVVDVHLPYRYRAKSIQAGFYGTILPFIQQESTFWNRTLHRHLDFDRLAKFRYAGDAYLWHAFSKHTQLTIVNTYLAGFRRHAGQLSSGGNYFKELSELSEKSFFYNKALAYVDKALWHTSSKIKKMFNKNILMFSTNTDSWC